MKPPLPPPCPTSWAEIGPQASRPACSSSRPSSSSLIPNVPHTELDLDTNSDSGSGSGSKISESSPHADACRHRRGVPRGDIAHTVSAADTIYLEKDPALDEVAAQTEEGFLALILNEDVLRGLDETPAWEPDDTVEPTPPHANKDTYPWPDSIHFLTHSLFRSPELRFLRSQQRAILQWAESCGMEHVLSLYSLDKCDQLLKECAGNPTRQFTSSNGNVYFMNSVYSALQQV
ncbi:hypothetical protein RSOLAG1IB_12333 [Rhizoctonia solani AG-1 IB]|uniref:Uncharacterized protein n=1 Tax=Thanatephorus cucumeris (strain AG1-IB / isolate 7/3/14) TaxID=1108050 RepID=A0A0B7FRE5_THACB|nr:hypothetical protein RSOLAG1IB_12333 [Rhizoctonia solani AG-1 IB]